jgi:hypothetical protein
MSKGLKRREFIRLAAAGGAVCATGSKLWPFASAGREAAPGLISPGCRGTRVKVARLFVAIPRGNWPKPTLDLRQEIAFYKAEFERMKNEFADIDFAVDELVATPEQVSALRERLEKVDGILAIHLNIDVGNVFNAILAASKPTVIFARPYSGHEWVDFGELRRRPLGAKLDCLLTTDTGQLAVAVRPFRAIHHLREAKVINLSTNDFSEYAEGVRSKFGTEIRAVGLDRMVALYNAIGDREARAEAERWIREAARVVEPTAEDIFRSTKLGLAFERLLEEEKATVMTVDCYGSMWDKTIKLPAYPCLGFSRLNDMGLGGICESDLPSAVTHIIFQGLVGRPGFVSDPTVDESRGSIILAHCMGTTRMDGPEKPAAPYKIRTVMERQEGVVPQVEMRVGQRVTQAILVGLDTVRYFTGTVAAAPVRMEDDRGCRTKVEVRVDGDITRLWQN